MTQEIIIRLQRNFMGCLWGDLMLLLGGRQPWTNKGSTTANPMHTYVCMYVMWCIVSLMQSKVHTNCLLGLVKKCRVSVWYFLVYTVYCRCCCCCCSCSWIQLFVYATHEFAVNFLLFFVEISFKNSFNPK